MSALTIFKIKDDIVDPDVILRDRDELDYSPVVIDDIRIGDLYYRRVERGAPAWLSYFGDAIDVQRNALRTASVAAVLLIEAGKKLFAITFGYGKSLLQDGVFETRFGLRATLNAVDPAALRSIDHKRLESVSRHTREQLSRAGALDHFGLDIERDLLSAVTGAPSNPKYGRRLSGADQLTAIADIPLAALKRKLEEYATLAEEVGYRKTFPWVDNIRAVSDPLLVAELDKQIVKDLKKGTTSVWLAPPEIIDWSVTEGFTYGHRKSATVYADLDIEDYFRELGGRKDLTAARLVHERIYQLRSDNPYSTHSWNIISCLVGECQFKSGRFILNENHWYEVKADFLQLIDDFISTIPITKISLPKYTGGGEGAYNEKAAKKSKGHLVLLDQNFIVFPQRGKVEVCDLYSKDRKFIHVKRGGASSTLSHLFNQGLVSSQLMVHEASFREKFQAKIPASHHWGNPKDNITPGDFEVSYAIVSRPGRTLELPFFSKVSLRTAARTLQQMGINVSIKGIDS